MKKLLIVADYNDADYSKDLVTVDEETFQKFLPLMQAINNFNPYVARHEYGGIVDNNWECVRQDLGEKTLYETYSQFTLEYIDEFQDIFMSGLNNPEAEYGSAFHTIITIQDVVTDEYYVNWRQDYDHICLKYDDKVNGYLKEKEELYSQCPGIGSIPFNRMTKEQKELLDKIHNLWRKYQ